MKLTVPDIEYGETENEQRRSKNTCSNSVSNYDSSGCCIMHCTGIQNKELMVMSKTVSQVKVPIQIFRFCLILVKFQHFHVVLKLVLKEFWQI